jgi:hypothetical protein
VAVLDFRHEVLRSKIIGGDGDHEAEAALVIASDLGDVHLLVCAGMK